MSQSNDSPGLPSNGNSSTDLEESMILACHLQQAMCSGKDLSCYRIVTKPRLTDPADFKSTAVEGVMRSKLSDQNCCILTDNHEYLVSTSVLKNTQTDLIIGDATVRLRLVGTVQWSKALGYLNFAKLLNEPGTKGNPQCQDEASRKEAIAQSKTKA